VFALLLLFFVFFLALSVAFVLGCSLLLALFSLFAPLWLSLLCVFSLVPLTWLSSVPTSYSGVLQYPTHFVIKLDAEAHPSNLNLWLAAWSCLSLWFSFLFVLLLSSFGFCLSFRSLPLLGSRFGLLRYSDELDKGCLTIAHFRLVVGHWSMVEGGASDRVSPYWMSDCFTFV
jgi:hypothetical protein